MVDFVELVPWFVEQLVVLGSSFSSPGFGSVGSGWNRRSGNGREHGRTKRVALTGSRNGQYGGPFSKRLTRSFEADAIEFPLRCVRGLQHGGADEVVGDEVHCKFFFDHFGREASQDVHTEGDLDVSQVEFNVPSAAVEFGEGSCGKFPGVGKGGGDGDALTSESLDVHGERYMAHQ